MQEAQYPLTFSVDYPDRQLDRLSSVLRIFWVIPIAIVLGAVGGGDYSMVNENGTRVSMASAGGGLFLGPLLMIVFRQKYPRWWYDWNLQFSRFSMRVVAYVALMNDKYPSTDEEQSVHLDFPYPDVPVQLNRWMPIVKWLLAVPHYVLLIFLVVGAIIGVIIAWFAILFTGRYPRGIFEYIEGVMRWGNRVGAYAFLLITDEYPPFRLSA